MTEPLLHLVTTDQWRAALAAGVLAPASLAEAGFVHLSTPEQVHLPAQRLLAGRTDVWLLVLDPARIPVEIRYEPGVHTDPESMRFPHAFGPVPLAAVTSVLPYRPVPDGGGFAPPLVPEQDAANRLLTLEPSVLRRAATAERPVTGGVAVLTEPFPASYQHNQLLVDGPTDAATITAEADRVLGEAGLAHRKVRLIGDGPAALGADLATLGWTVEPLIGMAAPVAAPEPEPGRAWAEEVERLRLTVLWRANWRRDQPGASDDDVDQLIRRYEREEPVCDLRYLAVFAGHRPVAACLVKLDGATALIDAVGTDPEHRGRGHGDTLLRTAHAIAAAAGCDLMVLDALEADWPRGWYARRGFAEVARVIDATLAPKRE